MLTAVNVSFHILAWLGLPLLRTAAASGGAVPESWPTETRAVFDQLVRDQRIVGAQLVIGRHDRVLLEHYAGTRSPGEPHPIDANTLFCIGSDSKPMVAALIMTMVADGTLQLDAPVSKWLPEFGSLTLQNGARAQRSPTLRELMCHRSSIFSQKQNATPEQLDLIHDFSRTLDASVQGIAQQPLIAQPGQAYAYSGAGYCVLGRAAEVAGGRPLEELLQTRLCRPLQLQRTTYFPANAANVAVGARRANGRWIEDRQAPHLTARGHRFTLVGGSIYSTAQDQGRFARMVLAKGRIDGKQILPPEVWSEWIRRQSPNGNYGLGWFQAYGQAGDSPFRLNHEGALACYRGYLVVNLRSGFFCAAHWTLAGPQNEENAGTLIRQVLHKAERLAVR